MWEAYNNDNDTDNNDDDDRQIFIRNAQLKEEFSLGAKFIHE